MRDVVVSTELVCHGVADTEEGIGEGHTCHAGCVCHLISGLDIGRLVKSSRQVLEDALHRLKSETIGIRCSHHGSVCLECMYENIESGCSGEAAWLCHHVVGIDDRHVRKQLVVRDRVLGARGLVGDNRERCYLRTGTRRGRDGYEECLLTHLRELVNLLTDIDVTHRHIGEGYIRVLVENPHDLTGIHRRTTTEGDDAIRLITTHLLSAFLSIGQGRIRLYV